MDVFLFARWSFYAEGYGYRGDRPGQVALLAPDGTAAEENFPLFADSLGAAVAKLAEKHRVVVINHVPEFSSSVPKSMLRTMRFGSAPLNLTVAQFEARTGRTVEAVRAAAEENGAVHVAPAELFCDDKTCHHAQGGVPLFIDNVHLGPRGNALLLQAVDAALDKEDQP